MCAAAEVQAEFKDRLQSVPPHAGDPRHSVCQAADGAAERGTAVRHEAVPQRQTLDFTDLCLKSLFSSQGQVQRRQQEGDERQPVRSGARRRRHPARQRADGHAERGGFTLRPNVGERMLE